VIYMAGILVGSVGLATLLVADWRIGIGVFLLLISFGLCVVH
jgi:hypothetical protein